MNANQNRHYSAADGALNVMDLNTGLWSGKLKVVQSRQVVENNLAAIDIFEATQTANTTGITQSRNEFKFEKGKLVFAVAQQVAAFAHAHGNAELENAVSFSEGRLQRGGDNAIHTRWKLVHDNAASNVLAMIAEDYDITELMVEDIETAMNDLNELSGKTKAAESGKVAATHTLDLLYESLGTSQEALMRNLSNVFLDNNTFRETMENVIKLDNSGIRHQAARVIVQDSVVQARMRNVKVTIVELNLVLFTSRRGVATFMSQNVPNGNYTVRIEFEGYVTQTINNVAVIEGDVKFLLVSFVKV